jgi:predicted ribosomally synthesized peptide with nif11-like leader
MSQRDAKRFVDRMEKDKKFAAPLKRAESNILKHADKHGFKFTRAEYYAHLSKRWGVKKPPVDDKDTCTVCACI